MNIKSVIRRNVIVNPYLRRKQIVEWTDNGYQIPVPPEFKQLSVQFYAATFKLDTLVETGTFFGDMVWAQKDYFRKIYSIELSKELYQRARNRFANVAHVELIQGDSSEKIEVVLNKLVAPALFWLDGHYSGGVTAKGEMSCPIYAELRNIFKSPFHHVILIDDARLFVGEDDYPTLDELAGFVSGNSKYEMLVENDMIILSIPVSRYI